MQQTAHLNGREDDRVEDRKELLGRVATRSEPTTTDVEDQGNDPETQSLRDRIEKVGRQGRPDRITSGTFESIVVFSAAVLLAGQRSDGTNGSGGFAGHVSRLGVDLLVLLVLEDNDFQADETGADEERNAGDTDQGKEGPESQSQDHTNHDRTDTLNDCPERDPGKTLHFLRVVTQRRGQSPSRVGVLVVESDVVSEKSLEIECAKFSSEVFRLGSESDLLNPDCSGGQNGNDKVPQCIPVGGARKLTASERKVIDSLSKDDGERGVDSTRADGSEESKDIRPFALLVDSKASLGEVK